MVTLAGLYLAYGSNLHPARLAARIGRIEQLAVVRLDGWELEFTKRGGDGSAKANLLHAGGAVAFGVVYRIDEACWPALDEYEGDGYERQFVDLGASNVPEPVQTYTAMPEWRSDALRPFDWYRKMVEIGARFHGFPDDYIARIAAAEAVPDSDLERSNRIQRVLQAMAMPGHDPIQASVEKGVD